jgi:hypothetical protein
MLRDGWERSHGGLAQELIKRWAAKLHAEVWDEGVSDDALLFGASLGHIRMRAMDYVPCCLIGGRANLSGVLHDFLKNSVPADLPFIITLSASAYEQAREILTKGRRVIFSPEQLTQLVRSHDPDQFLKLCIRQQVHRRVLIPYNINVPAEGGMFFGRENEVSRLLEENFTSFAIAGPGRIGKTSLLRQYRAMALRHHTRPTGIGFYVSMYDAKPATAARFLAMRIDPSSRSNRVTADDLINFLKYQKARRGAPLELLLDEVDGVCRSDAFRYLGEAAKNELCRLVMCGRGELLRAMLDKDSPLQGRAELIRVEPLDETAGRALIKVPLTDLGFEMEQPAQLTEQLLSLTGRLPHLLQHMCKALIEVAVDEKSESITLGHLGKVKGDFLTAEFFINSIRDLTDSREQLVALRLVAGTARRFTTGSVYQVACEEKLKISFDDAHLICNNLVINNVLAWDGGSYTLANEGLPFFAQQTGYLDGALASARAAAKSAN